jgi:peptidoglycan/LPS O-acetylase OafA/YrhL
MSKQPSDHLHPKYRPYIDGLRAVAVLSVLGYHAAPGRVPGGFIGVDIFFIISGFLISSIIFSNLERGTFSITDFYNRRIRRIFPALSTLLVATVVFGWFALVATEYAYLGKHVASGAGFVSNGVLYSESGYFDSAVEAKPMLHLWSLAIEEQFYLLWPLTLAFVWRRKWNFLGVTAAIGLLSFAVNVYLSASNPSAAFYWPISRFWQLMIGGVLAYLTLHRPELLRRNKNAQSIVGFSLVAIALLLIDRHRAFPGWWALLPSLGTFFIISSGSEAWLNRYVLSRKLLVWIGLISYPLYLWHWPMLSFARIFEGTEVSQRLRLELLCLAFLLAWITYRLIELPIRQNRSIVPVVALGCTMVFVGSVGLYCFFNGGFRSRSNQPTILNAGDIGHERFEREYVKYSRCSSATRAAVDSGVSEFDVCRQSLDDKDLEIAILGDSHALPTFMAFASSFTGVNVGVFARDALPLVHCKEFESVYKYVLSNPNILTVILAAHWSGRFASATDRPTLERELSDTAELLSNSGKQVYITSDNPDFTFAPSRCKFAGRFGQTNLCTQDSKLLENQRAKYEPFFESLVAKSPRLKLLDTADCFCKESYCSMASNGLLLFEDKQHLNVNGARFLANCLRSHYPELGFPPNGRSDVSKFPSY